MNTRALGSTRPHRLRDRPRLHGDVRPLRARRRRREHRHDPRRARRRRQPARHRRLLRDGRERDADSPRASGARSRRGRDQRQVRRPARPGRRLERRRRPPGGGQELPRLHACAGSAPITSTSTGWAATTPRCRSRRRSERSARWSRPATFATSASPRSEPRRSAAPTLTHPISDLQIEYSLISRGIEAEILPTCSELGIGVTAYGVLSRGLLSGHWSRDRETGPADFRSHAPRFSGENLERNLELVEALRAIAEEKAATVAQVAIAWVLSRGERVVPLVGARTRDRLAESLGALELELSADDLAAIEAARAGRGGRRRALRRPADGDPRQRTELSQAMADGPLTRRADPRGLRGRSAPLRPGQGDGRRRRAGARRQPRQRLPPLPQQGGAPRRGRGALAGRPLRAPGRDRGPATAPRPERLRRWLDLLVSSKQRRARDDPELFATYVRDRRRVATRSSPSTWIASSPSSRGSSPTASSSEPSPRPTHTRRVVPSSTQPLASTTPPTRRPGPTRGSRQTTST